MSETALLLACRQHLMERCGIKDSEINIEGDEEAIPNMAGKLYVIISPAGVQEGPSNPSSGGVLDEIYSVDVIVCMRVGAVPKDRERQRFLENHTGVTAHCNRIKAAIHFEYDLLKIADSLITDSQQKFVMPLRFQNLGRWRPVTFGDSGPGIARTVSFTGAQRIQYQTSQQ